MPLELLSPAKNLDYGREAVNHGADALYVGAPAFGARAAATNTMADIEALVRYAHLYRAKVYATVNTLLFDNELEEASAMVKRLYEAGVDALIVQDMGLLECDLPPIELHASTQCHNAEPDRIKFLEQVGFKRVILARETSLEQMAQISQVCQVELEAFVHGALCVSYSGQCYMSQYLNRRSGNRGCCSQPCRSTYDLYTDTGRLLVKGQHLLSLKDFNASQHLSEMARAGICSFKIEGRLKDLGYVKNITAHYRQALDSLSGGGGQASSGRCTFFFTPDVERTFNRGYTDYFLSHRQQMASFSTQKSIGKAVGRVTKVGRRSLGVDVSCRLAPGDGLCYLGADGQMKGFYVNQVHDSEIVPNAMPDLDVGTQLWRNHDHLFEKTLQGRSAERKIGIRIRFHATNKGFGINMIDEDGNEVWADIEAEHEAANEPSKMSGQIVRQLSKLGSTPFAPTEVKDQTEGKYFLPTSILNQIRTNAAEQLAELRITRYAASACTRNDSGAPYPTARLDYRGNVVNGKAEEFYKKHGVSEIEHGVEQTEDYRDKALMTTKYCLRHELGCCLKQSRPEGKRPDIKPTDRLLLHNNGHWFNLAFDCQNCRMEISLR